MKLANASCLDILRECGKGTEFLEVEEMDAEQLAWLVVYGTGETRVFVKSVACSLDPSRFMKGSPKRENIVLAKPKDEFIYDVFSGYVVVE
nr:hypothetical protein [Marseillevirus cajuinensis]WRK65417.1 hypothetical protein MarFTME_372 [Marseillevirus futianmevirus]